MKLLVSSCAETASESPLPFESVSLCRPRFGGNGVLKLFLALTLVSLTTTLVLADSTLTVEPLSKTLAAIPEHSETLIRGEPIDSGNVVVRGEYVEPPYRITLAGRNVFINDEQITSLPEQSNTEKVVTAGEFIARLERTLFWGSTLIVFDDETRLVVDSMAAEEFFASMLNAETIQEKVQIVFEQADYDEFSKNRISTAQWRAALENFPSSAAVGECVDSECPGSAEYATHATDQDHVGAEKSHTAWAMYLLNSTGMLLASVSLGVLITNPPNANATWIATLRSHAALQLVKRCLILSVILSVFDLVSTITAESTGGFAEANPLAAFLLHDPSILTFAKLFGTCLTTGLLWSQRQYVGVQLASWWICFVLTLVTIRWVVVDSLFYV